MNDYAKHAIRRFHALYQQRNFDQDDVALLLVMARDYTPKGSLFRELGDFLAHPDRKDRGLLIAEIQRIAPLYEEFLIEDYRLQGEGLRHDYEKGPRFNGITSEQMANELAFVYSLGDISANAVDKNSNSFREFLACVILLLEPCHLAVNGQTLRVQVEYGHSIVAFVKYESALYRNHFVLLTVLVLRNVNINATWLNRKFKLTNVLARRHRCGRLFAISHDNDLVDGFMDRDEYQGGEAYDLNPIRPNQRT